MKLDITGNIILIFNIYNNLMDKFQYKSNKLHPWEYGYARIIRDVQNSVSEMLEASINDNLKEDVEHYLAELIAIVDQNDLVYDVRISCGK